MRRGRGKAKKQNVVSSLEDPGSGEEEKIPAYKRRGRPQKQMKDDVDEDEVEKPEEDGIEDIKSSIPNKEVKNQPASENGRKRKKPMQAKENLDSIKKANGITTKSSIDDSTKSVGYRQNGSRRKNKPRRAAEAVVECK